MRNCFVPNCDAYCKKHGINKRMMFSAPKNNFEKWKQKLFNKREFRESDRICERHFDQNQIITHWDHVIAGKLCKLERDKPKLEPLAVPYLNLPEIQDDIPPKSNINKTKKSKGETKRRKPDDNVCEKNLENNKKFKESTKKAEYSHAEDILEGDFESNSVKKLKKLSPEEKWQSFDLVYDDVYEIVLPSTLWGIHRDPINRQYIAFTKFDVNKMTCTKVLNINNEFEMKVLVDGVQKKASSLDVINVDVITSLLNQLDEFI